MSDFKPIILKQVKKYVEKSGVQVDEVLLNFDIKNATATIDCYLDNNKIYTGELKKIEVKTISQLMLNKIVKEHLKKNPEDEISNLVLSIDLKKEDYRFYLKGLESTLIETEF